VIGIINYTRRYFSLNSLNWYLALLIFHQTTNVHFRVKIFVRSYYFYFYFFINLSGVRLSALGTVATTGLLYQPQMICDGDSVAIGGMKIGRRNRSTRREPAPAPLCLSQIPHDQTQARTRAAAVGSQRLISWATVISLVVSFYLEWTNV
jgi:hypothetical protein